MGQILEKGLDGLSALAGFGAKSKEEVETALKQLDLPFIPVAKEKKEKKKASSASASEKDENAESVEGEITD